MKLVLLSDTHASHWDVTVPDGDVLIHAGDVMGRSFDKGCLRDVAKWFAALPHPHKILVPGNHDGIFQQKLAFCREVLEDVHVLIDEALEIDGITFYGSPWTPTFFNWYFMKDRDVINLQWEQIPHGTDVLITHGPPHGIRDYTVFQHEHAGDEALLHRVRKVTPKIHVFGHIHEGAGIESSLGTTFVNASVLNQNYDVVHTPHVIQL